MMTNRLKSLLITGTAGLSFASSPALATVVFLTGNNPQPGDQTIQFSGGTGTTVSGLTNMTDTLVDFTSMTGQTLMANSSGQAKITTNNNGGLLTSIDVTSPSHTFQDFIADTHDSGPFTITVTANDGTFNSGVLPGGSGSNFMTIVAQGNETISSVVFTSSAGFGSFEQPRISGISAAVPEPSTWAMILLGFAGLGFAFRQSRRRVSFA